MNTKNIIAGSIGTLVEWTDLTLYAFLAVHFAALFFPMFSDSVSLLAAFGGFAVSYLARPVGSLIFGALGDQRGRKKSLYYSLLLMGLSTAGIGLLPAYSKIGIYAPILLITFRFMQGISMGGEFLGAAVFLIEHRPQQPYLSSSWVSTASAAGMLVGEVAGLILLLPHLPEWAWRVPFLMGSVICLIGLYIRYRLSETVTFQQLLKTHALAKAPLKQIFSDYRKPLLQTATIGIYVAIYIYIYNVWWATYLLKSHAFTAFEARLLATCGQAFVVILTPVMAILAEKYPSRNFMSGGLLASLFIGPLLYVGSVYQFFSGMLLVNFLYAICLAAVTATMFKHFTDLFPPAIRYTGQTLSWSLGVAIFGGSAPALAQLLYMHHLSYLIIVYVMISILVAYYLNTPYPAAQNINLQGENL
jgi:MFS transporter, MHS family, proline/betaine transporter